MQKKKQFYNDYHKHNKNRKFFNSISENNFTYYLTIKNLNRLISSEKKIKNVLDVGCGVGAIDFYLNKIGLNIYGIDISSDAIRIADQYRKYAKLSNIDFSVCDVTDFKSIKKYDLVICSEVIEHVENEKLLLSTIRKHIVPSGFLYLSTPSLNAPLYKLGLLKNFDNRVGHLRRYELDGLIKLINSNGFEVIVSDKNESIIRNSLFTFKPLGFLIKFIRFGFLVRIFHFVDDIFVKLFGESDLIIIARKK